MQAVLRIDALPDEALEAAALFYAEYVPQIRDALDGDVESLAILLPGAPHDHTAWRKAAVQDLAREVAPKRINVVTGRDCPAMDATLEWLESAPGITGQLLPVDGTAATITA